jgi:hypothetical protein
MCPGAAALPFRRCCASWELGRLCPGPRWPAIWAGALAQLHCGLDGAGGELGTVVADHRVRFVTLAQQRCRPECSTVTEQRPFRYPRQALPTEVVESRQDAAAPSLGELFTQTTQRDCSRPGRSVQ